MIALVFVLLLGLAALALMAPDAAWWLIWLARICFWIVIFVAAVKVLTT